MTETPVALAGDFPAPTLGQWRALVDKALKGADFETRLVARTADGIAIEPLYTRMPRDSDAAAIAARSSTGQGWDIRQRHADRDPATANAAILDDLAGGATSITLQIASPGGSGLPCDGATIARTLRGVLLGVCPVALDAGEYTPDAAGSLMALWRNTGLAPDQCLGAFDYDPLGTLAATGALYHPIDRSLAVAAGLVAEVQAMGGVTALAANGTVWHRGGATEAQELACIVASIVAYLRAGEAAGIAPARTLPKIAVVLAVDADQLMGLAKLRAARRLIGRIAGACGAADAANSVPICAETSSRMMSRRDPWVNMLRTTIACATAAIGGASAITVHPFTWALGRPDAFARRIARNTHHVLIAECGLGRVADPAGGSFAIEQLTDALAGKAWSLFQAIEAEGGLAASLASGAIQARIAAAATERARQIATGRIELIGTSAFARLGDDGAGTEPWPQQLLSADLNGMRVEPLAARRDAEPFERLRDAADAAAVRPRVFLACLGDRAEHGARATWVRNVLAAGGIDAVASGDLHATPEVGRAFAESGATVACLVSSDAVYGRLGEAAAGVLRQAGASHVALAGRPSAQLAALEAAGVGSMLHAGCDRIAALSLLHAALGIGATP